MHVPLHFCMTLCNFPQVFFLLFFRKTMHWSQSPNNAQTCSSWFWISAEVWRTKIWTLCAEWGQKYIGLVVKYFPLINYFSYELVSSFQRCTQIRKLYVMHNPDLSGAAFRNIHLLRDLLTFRAAHIAANDDMLRSLSQCKKLR